MPAQDVYENAREAGGGVALALRRSGTTPKFSKVKHRCLGLNPSEAAT